MRSNQIVMLMGMTMLIAACMSIDAFPMCGQSQHDLLKNPYLQAAWLKSNIYAGGGEVDPAIQGITGRIFVGTQDPDYGPTSVLALDTLTGNKLWQQPIGLPAGMLVGDDTLYTGENNVIRGYNSETGKLIHEFTLPNTGSLYQMYFSEENIFALTASSRALIYNVSSDTLNLSQPFLPYQPFMIQNGILYLDDDLKGFEAQDIKTKQILWVYKSNFNGPRAQMKPLFTQDSMIVLTTLGDIYAINKATGTLNWHVDAHAISNVASDGSHLYFLAEDGFLVMVDEAGGQVIWRVGFSNVPFAVSTPERLVGGYNAWVDPQNRIIVASLGDSCQLVALKETGQ